MNPSAQHSETVVLGNDVAQVIIPTELYDYTDATCINIRLRELQGH